MGSGGKEISLPLRGGETLDCGPVLVCCFTGFGSVRLAAAKELLANRSTTVLQFNGAKAGKQ